MTENKSPVAVMGHPGSKEPQMSMKETIARAIVRRLTDKLWTKSGPELFTRYGCSSADAFFDHAWKTDYNLLRGRALADVDEMCEALMEPTEGMRAAARDALYEFGIEAYLAGYSGDDPDLRAEYADAWGAVVDPFRAMIRAIKDGK